MQDFNPYQPPGKAKRYAAFPIRFWNGIRRAIRAFREGAKRDDLKWYNIVAAMISILLVVWIAVLIIVTVIYSMLAALREPL